MNSKIEKKSERICASWENANLGPHAVSKFDGCLGHLKIRKSRGKYDTWQHYSVENAVV